MSSFPYTNRLINEKSPYLQQHAHNPVEWYPWGEEAFAKAKQEDKPIFLSIGYATCHWCHVMEKESFGNPEIAKLMNEAFVNVKVDREELPEIDGMYMEFAQALMASAGGWPLNLVLTPDLKPFFAVTYLPPVNQKGLIGIQQFIQYIQQLWHSEDKPKIIEQADKIVEMFSQAAAIAGTELPQPHLLQIAEEVLFEGMDPVYGGLKGEPKFPMGYQCLFLLEQARSKADSRALFCVELTLDRMMHGGIYDPLGGGFSRYSVDERWEVPHFEKMLYDNALLASAYLQASQFLGNASYQKVAERTLAYLLGEMKHPEGGFYSAEDADVAGHEGMYYTWTMREIRDLLSNEEAEIFCQYYSISESGNFEGRNVLHSPFSLEEFSEALQLPISEVDDLLEKARSVLLKQRSLRQRPFKDDKIICSWNGLMIDTLVQASQILKEEKYAAEAINTAEFLYKNFYKEGRLLRRWREGEARFQGGIDDYAFLIKGLLSLFEHRGDSRWLKWAIELSDLLVKDFKAEEGAFYFHIPDPTLLIRKCEFYDGAEPSGNAVHCENLLRLFQITGSSTYLSLAEDILKASKVYIESYPPGATYHLKNLQRYYDKQAAMVVIALDEANTLEQEIRECLYLKGHPHRTVIWKRPKDTLLETLIPSLVDKKTIDGQTAVYVCKPDHCEAPLLDKAAILRTLG